MPFLSIAVRRRLDVVKRTADKSRGQNRHETAWCNKVAFSSLRNKMQGPSGIPGETTTPRDTGIQRLTLEELERLPD